LRERAVLRFTTLLTAHPGGVEQRDLDELGAHLSPAEALELMVVIATAKLDQPVQRRAPDAA
jgi:alkylhydroperoxidase family enzyme